ncbi:AMP-binding protein [Marinibaculum pumilum]|uniref:Long-chain-fatty-acid--CoA ligase n=1 Tax=Marinibaculum pumilum TaxID=1766165 RepID=A0ABV7L1I2_9PROT
MPHSIDTVTGLIAARAAEAPGATAVIADEGRLDYGGLDALGRRAAAGLAALGVGAGSRVAFWLPNSLAYLGLYLGCCRLGATAVAVNTRYRSAEVGDIVGRSGASVLVLWPGFRGIDFLGLLEGCDPAALAGIRHVVTVDPFGQGGPARLPGHLDHAARVDWHDLAGAPAMAPADGRDRAAPEAHCNIFTTSGTTRAPKFVAHHQASIAGHAQTAATAFGYPARRGGFMCVLPFCGVFGFNQVMAALAAGRPAVIRSAFDPAEVVALMDEHGVTDINGTDDMLAALMDAAGGPAAMARTPFIGWAAWGTGYETLGRRADAAGIRFCGLFGMSEIQALFSARPADDPVERRLKPGGTLASPVTEIRVRDPDNGAVLGMNAPGELEVRGPSLMAGYADDPAATAAAFTADGWFRTGDLAQLDGPRSLLFLQRMGDVLRLGGFLVSPAEIEAQLQAGPGIAAAQVVGVPGPDGTRPVGFVTLADGAGFDEAALQAHCAARLARFKVPVRIFALDDFPRAMSPNGMKIQRAALRRLAEEALQA